MDFNTFDSNYTDLYRYELKYLISEDVIASMRQYLKLYCDRDKFNGDNEGYEITSLYLDTPQKQFVRDNKNDLPYRMKMRLRTYDSDPENSVHFEIKRKANELIHKTRSYLPHGHWREGIEDLNSCKKFIKDEKAWKVLENFNTTRERLGATPSVIVRYKREAFMSNVDDYARVTFDRKICAQMTDHWSFDVDPKMWRSIDLAEKSSHPASMVVLELKCSSRVPEWMLRFIRDFNLERTGFSKYVISYDRAQLDILRDPMDRVSR
jgi:hypothetical protein